MELATPSLESIWRELRPHLEWANGFNLVFLFADNPGPVGLLRRRFDDSLHLRTLRLRVMDPSSPEELAGLAEQLLTLRAGFGPLWVELWRQGEDPAWRRARVQLLHQLNERRSILEREIRQPVVLVLPLAERSQVYISAPDLWAVRSFTAQLPTLAPSRPDTILPSVGESKSVLALASEPSPAEQEWTRLLNASQNATSLNLGDGFAAFDAALERGSLKAARHIANETLAMARDRVQLNANPEHLRDLSVSLNKVGQVEAELGKLEPARAAYRESLGIARQLRDSLGDTPQALRDLSISLDNVGKVEAELGKLDAARAAYRESLDLSRQLRDSLGDTPQALRDLSISLDNVGKVEAELGKLDAARAAYRESLDLSRQLRQAFPDHAQLRRDLEWIEARWAEFIQRHGEA
jgi:tetratricopeptide (TPR) repeat protein